MLLRGGAATLGQPSHSKPTNFIIAHLMWLIHKPIQANLNIADTMMLHRNDLQPLLLGASAANVHLRTAKRTQPGEEAMESATNSSIA